MFVYPQWRLRRAIPKVVPIFRRSNAVDIKNAKTLDELGLKLPSMMHTIFGRRDYKRYALQALIRAEIIQVTEDGKFYLSEENLLASKLRDL